MTGPIVLSEHARWQAGRRGLDEATILSVARSPEQVLPVRPGREIRQSVVTLPPEGREYLVRVVVDSGALEEIVVTVYRTSKIGKYRR